MRPVLTERAAQQSQPAAFERIDCPNLGLSTHTNAKANNFENDGMLFAQLFPVKSEESLEWRAAFLGRVFSKKISSQTSRIHFLPVGSSVCGFKKTRNTVVAVFAERQGYCIVNAVTLTP